MNKNISDQYKLRLALGYRFRVEREAQQLSQEDVAEIAGTSRNTITNLENGHDIKLSTFIALSVALDVEPRIWFLSDEEWLVWYRESKKARKV